MSFKERMLARLRDPNFHAMIGAAIVAAVSGLVARQMTWEGAAVSIVGALFSGLFGIKQPTKEQLTGDLPQIPG